MSVPVERTQQTPRPWRVNDPDTNRGRCDGIVTVALDEDGYPRQIVETDSGYYPPNLPDAELIVRAVNAHDVLVAAAKRALAYFDRASIVGETPDGLADAVKLAETRS